jgi:ketosteroid isomerase-like protein
MRIKLSLLLVVIVFFSGCRQSQSTDSPKEDVIKTAKDEAKRALLSVYDFINTNDLSDSLTFNKWPSYFTKDILFISSNGKAPNPFPFDMYRGIFKTLKVSYDQMTIDRVDASGDLAYVLYHFHELAKKIETGEVVKDALISAVVTLKKDAAGKWKIAVIGYS